MEIYWRLLYYFIKSKKQLNNLGGLIFQKIKANSVSVKAAPVSTSSPHFPSPEANTFRAFRLKHLCCFSSEIFLAFKAKLFYLSALAIYFLQLQTYPNKPLKPLPENI